MTTNYGSLSTMKRRIYSALLSASNQEITDGMDFYPGANGLWGLDIRVEGILRED